MADRIAAAPAPKMPFVPADCGRIWAGAAGESAWLDADSQAARQELAALFAPYEASPADPPGSGVFAQIEQGPLPRLTLILAGKVCDPARMFAAGPEWKRFTRLGHPSGRLYADSLLGAEPVLEAAETELIVLRPDLWLLYLGLAHGWLLMKARTLVGLHSAVAAAHGKAMVLVGASGSGKSTLSFALMEQGADSFGDECSLFRLPNLTLFPWPRPLHMRPGGLEVLGAKGFLGSWQEVRPGDPKCLVDLTASKSPCPSDRVAFYFLDGFAERPALGEIRGAEASRRLLKGMIYGDPDPFERLKIAADMVSRYPCCKLTLGKPGDTAAMLLDHSRGL
jgi:hypothetical protein